MSGVEAKEAKRAVKAAWNKVHCPALSTGEVAEELGVSVEEAYKRLEASAEIGHLDKKQVAKTDEDDPRNWIWW